MFYYFLIFAIKILFFHLKMSIQNSVNSKSTYYLKNSEEQKLKSLRRYYVNQLKNDNLSNDRKAKYETKLAELNEKLESFNSSRAPKSNTHEDRNLKSLRNYYIKQLRNPELDSNKKAKYEAKLEELNSKINHIEVIDTNLEELLQDKSNYESKLKSLEELKIKYQTKLQEINDKIDLLSSNSDKSEDN